MHKRAVGQVNVGLVAIDPETRTARSASAVAAAAAGASGSTGPAETHLINAVGLTAIPGAASGSAAAARASGSAGTAVATLDVQVFQDHTGGVDQEQTERPASSPA